MILDKKACQRFFKLYYSFIGYANGRLKVVNRLYDYFGYVRDDEAFRVALEVFDEDRHLDLVDDFVRENPDGLSRRDLNEVASWSHAICDYFFVLNDGRDNLFTHGKYVFCVRGLSREIEDVCGKLPVHGLTVLLPFDGMIVYAGTMVKSDVGLGPSITQGIYDEANEAKKSGCFMRSARDFLKYADEYKEKRKDSRDKGLPEDEGLGAHVDDEVAGQHRSPLAGLSGEERWQAKKRLINEALQEGLDELVCSDLRRLALKKKPPENLEDYFFGFNKSHLVSLSRELGVKGALSRMNKRQLAKELVEKAPRTVELVMIMLRELGPKTVLFAKRLVEADGRVECAYEDAIGKGAIVMPASPIFDLYDTGSCFCMAMPREYVELIRDVDFDSEADTAARVHEAVHFIQLSCELRGVIDVLLACREYEEFSGHTLSLDETAEVLELVHEQGANAIRPIVPTYVDSMPVLVCEYMLDGDDIDEAEARDLFEEQEGRPHRPVTEEMMRCDSIIDWVRGFESAQTLISYLDEHVPDGADDLYFSEDLVSDVIVDLFSMTGIFRIANTMEESGFLPTQAQLSHTMSLITELAKDVPKWAFNGWSSNEVERLEDEGKWPQNAKAGSGHRWLVENMAFHTLD